MIILTHVQHPFAGPGFMVRDTDSVPARKDSAVAYDHPETVKVERCISGTFGATRIQAWAEFYRLPARLDSHPVTMTDTVTGEVTTIETLVVPAGLSFEEFARLVAGQ